MTIKILNDYQFLKKPAEIKQIINLNFYKIYNNLTPVYLKTPIPAPKQYSSLRTNKPH